METLDQVSMIAIVVSAVVVAVHFSGYQLPQQVVDLLSNQYTQIALGLGVVAGSYYHLPSALVLASVLFVALNQNNAEGMENGVSGKVAKPAMDQVENPMPTQETTVPTEEDVVPQSTLTPDVAELEQQKQEETSVPDVGYEGGELASV